MQDALWNAEAAYVLWRRGRLSLGMSLKWARYLKQRFQGRWTAQQAAQWQLEQWQD